MSQGGSTLEAATAWADQVVEYFDQRFPPLDGETAATTKDTTRYFSTH